ncbi:MAG TPA: periplasmic heavy metal sensor [Bacteroidetes bacterium]|nr:periplasmic heavy metal sensor [Bacteroidota bacterium]
MDQIKVNRSIRWLNYLLLIINLTALCTLIFFRPHHEPDRENLQVTSLEFLREELGLTGEQYQEVVRLDETTYRTYHLIIDLLCEANIELLEELAKETPDQEVLDRLTRKIGNLNTSLKKATIRHFDHIRSICNEEQKARLIGIFKEIMQLEEQCEICNRKECPRKTRLENLGKMEE